MQDRPSASELLEAVAEYLFAELRPEVPREQRFVNGRGESHPQQGHVSPLPANRSRAGGRRNLWLHAVVHRR